MVKLPVMGIGSEKKDTPKKGKNPPAVSAKKLSAKVLIVEDSPHLRNGLAKTFKPDTALVDIGLPDINGYRVAEQLRCECQLIRAGRLVCPNTYTMFKTIIKKSPER